MDFQIDRQIDSESSITLVIKAIYTQEEADALTEAHAWDTPCIDEISAFVGIKWDRKPDDKISAPTFYDLMEPGVSLEDFSPYFADRFETNFNKKYTVRIQEALRPFLRALRRSDRKELDGQKGRFFGRDRSEIPYDPMKRLPPR